MTSIIQQLSLRCSIQYSVKFLLTFISKCQIKCLFLLLPFKFMSAMHLTEVSMIIRL